MSERINGSSGTVVRIACKRCERRSVCWPCGLRISVEPEFPTRLSAESWSIKTQTWLSQQRERPDYTVKLHAGHRESTVYQARHKNKADSLKELGDRYRYSWNTVPRLMFTNTKALAVSWEGGGYFSPSPFFSSMGAIAWPAPKITCG